MSLLKNLSKLFTSREPISIQRIMRDNKFNVMVEAESSKDSELFAAIARVTSPVKPSRPGRVVHGTKRPTYKPDARKSGGRVVKVMPKELRRIKEAQEKPVEND